jgi:hypothetical protein
MASSFASLALVAFLRLRRADVEEPGKAADLPQQLEELGLPVLQRVAAHLDDVLRDLDRFIVLVLLADEGEPAEQPMADQRKQEECKGDPRVTKASAHGLDPALGRFPVVRVGVVLHPQAPAEPRLWKRFPEGSVSS